MQVSIFTQAYRTRFSGSSQNDDFAKRMAVQNRETQETIKRSELEEKQRKKAEEEQRNTYAANNSKKVFKKGSVKHPRTPSPKFSANA